MAWLMKRRSFKRRRRGGCARGKATDRELLGDLRRAAELCGAERLSGELYKRVGGFGRMTYIRRFGSWNKALLAAGLKPSRMMGVTRRELIGDIRRVGRKLGCKTLMSREYEEHGGHSMRLVRRHFPSWEAAVWAAGLKAGKRRGNPGGLGEGHETVRRVSYRLRYLTLRRDGFRCRACGGSPATDVGVRLQVDHIVAWSRGGETRLENLQTLCEACNFGKSDLDWDFGGGGERCMVGMNATLNAQRSTLK